MVKVGKCRVEYVHDGFKVRIRTVYGDVIGVAEDFGFFWNAGVCQGHIQVKENRA